MSVDISLFRDFSVHIRHDKNLQYDKNIRTALFGAFLPVWFISDRDSVERTGNEREGMTSSTGSGPDSNRDHRSEL